MGVEVDLLGHCLGSTTTSSADEGTLEEELSSLGIPGHANASLDAIG